MLQLQLFFSLLSAYRIGAESVDYGHDILDLMVAQESGAEKLKGDAFEQAEEEALTILEGLSLEEEDDVVFGSLDRQLEDRLRRAEADQSEGWMSGDEDTKSQLQSILAHMTASVKSAKIKRDGMALLVSNERGETVFDVRTKSFTPWTKRNVASGSKLIAGITLLKCINDTPRLSLQSTTGEILGWKKNGDLTIDILGAFASGSLPGASNDPTVKIKQAANPNPSVSTAFELCLMKRWKTTTQCVNEHLKDADFTGRGTSRYEPFGPSHAIVAVMCEKASGRSFMSWFNELKNTFGIKDRDFTYSCPACWNVNAKFPFGNAWQWRKNPFISGGLTANAVHLRKWLTFLVNKGMHNGKQLIAEDLILRMGRSEYKGTNYGWFSGINGCPKGVQCSTFGHGGAWGMMMWANLDVGYSAVVMMMSDPSEKFEEPRQFTNMRGPMEQIKKILDEALAPAPTPSPTDSPTQSPTESSTDSPTQSRIESPTQSPTDSPTQSPTESPTLSPTASTTPAPPPALERNMKTKSGCTCLNSWSFKGKKYQGCSKTPGYDKPWCRFNLTSCFKGWKSWQNWDWCKSEMVAASKK